MGTAFSTFQRLKDKGLTAYRRGDLAVARPYLIQAAECMIELAERAASSELRSQHESCARELIALARKCESAPSKPAQRRAAAGETEASEPSAEDWIVRQKPAIGFDDIAGLDNVKNEIRLRMLYPLQHPELAQRYGVRTGGGLLLYGPPGTGKTMLAKAVAHEIDATFFVVSAAQILSKWVGEAEQNIRRLFEEARKSELAVIFLDEIEALVPRRKEDSSAVMQRVVPQILQEIEGFASPAAGGLLFIGATNRPWMLDEAILRPGRFDTCVYIPLPDAAARYRMLEMYLAQTRPLADDVDLGQLCDLLEGCSGADIRAIADRAAAIPFMEAVTGQEPRAIGMTDLVTVASQAQKSVRAEDLQRFEVFERTRS